MTIDTLSFNEGSSQEFNQVNNRPVAQLDDRTAFSPSTNIAPAYSTQPDNRTTFSPSTNMDRAHSTQAQDDLHTQMTPNNVSIYNQPDETGINDPASDDDSKDRKGKKDYRDEYYTQFLKEHPRAILVSLDSGASFSAVDDELISAVSAYFNAALGGGWIETSSHILQLEFSSAAWAVFQGWIEKNDRDVFDWLNTAAGRYNGPHNGEFVLRTVLEKDNDVSYHLDTVLSRTQSTAYDDIDDPRCQYLDFIIEVYTLADYLEAPAFANAVIDEFIKALEQYWKTSGGELPWHMFDNVWAVTAPKSAIRRVLLDALFAHPPVGWASEDTMEEILQSGHITGAATIVDIAVRGVRGVESAPWEFGHTNTCCYHMHPGKDRDEFKCKDAFGPWKGDEAKDWVFFGDIDFEPVVQGHVEW